VNYNHVIVRRALIVGSATAYEAGRDAADSAVDCAPGDVLSIHISVTESESGRTIDRTLRLGKCERIGDHAFSAALKALASSLDASKECATKPDVSTGAATATSTTTASNPAGVPSTTDRPCLPS